MLLKGTTHKFSLVGVSTWKRDSHSRNVIDGQREIASLCIFKERPGGSAANVLVLNPSSHSITQLMHGPRNCQRQPSWGLIAAFL